MWFFPPVMADEKLYLDGAGVVWIADRPRRFATQCLPSGPRKACGRSMSMRNEGVQFVAHGTWGPRRMTRRRISDVRRFLGRGRSRGDRPFIRNHMRIPQGSYFRLRASIENNERYRGGFMTGKPIWVVAIWACVSRPWVRRRAEAGPKIVRFVADRRSRPIYLLKV